MSRSFDVLVDDLESIGKNQDKLLNFMHDKIENRSIFRPFMQMADS